MSRAALPHGRLVVPGRAEGPALLPALAVASAALFVVSGAARAAEIAVSRTPSPPPSMTLRGPYGSPLALAPPRPLFALADIPGKTLPLGASPSAAGDGVAVHGSPERPDRPSRSASVADEEEEMAAALAGRVGRAPTKVPGAGRDRKSEIVAPHVTPDVEFALSRRASLGMFGEVGRVEVDARSGLVPTVKARDLGAGLTLQYRFGP